MPYGTENGISNNLIDYADLVVCEAITEDMAADCRAAADAIIDARLAAAVGFAALPLSSPPAVVNGISDDLAMYFLLRRLFTGSAPNDSEWVDKFYKRPLELLDKLVESGGALASGSGYGMDSKVSTTTPNQDRIFTVERTSGGASVCEPFEGTMEDW
ncbi:MAG TPA: DUF1320 family protein [bacterium]|nr:DUF1320 family protein [bacterium]